MSRLDTVKTKYSEINWDLWSKADPSKNFKYLEWIGKNNLIDFFKDKPNEEQINSTKNLLLSFEKNSAKLTEKDINKYQPATLSEALSKVSPSAKEIKELGVKDLGEVDRVQIRLIESPEAAKKYFAGTRWCISQPHHFFSYCKRQNIFLLSRNGAKYCLLVSLKSPEQKKYELYHVDDSFITFDFKDVNFFELTNVINKCVEYTKKYKNIWATSGKKVDDNYIKLVEKYNLLNYLNLESDETQIMNILKFLKDNQKKYPVLIKKISTSRKSKYVRGRWQYSPVEQYIEGHRLYLSKIWKDLISPPKKKPDEKAHLLDEIKKNGGLQKLIKTQEQLVNFKKFVAELGVS